MMPVLVKLIHRVKRNMGGTIFGDLSLINYEDQL